MKSDSHTKNWYRLDNIAALHSLCFNKQSTFVFRISCTLKQAVKLSALENSLQNIMQRFPYYNVCMKSGFFWYNWQHNKKKVTVQKDLRFPCRFMDLHSGSVTPIKVYAFYNTISCEFHHSITDGGGGVLFIKALLAEYFKEKEHIHTDDGSIPQVGQQLLPEEYEDSFQSRYNKSVPAPEKKIDALRLDAKLLKQGFFHTTTGTISAKSIIELARSKQVTVTEYLSAVYIDALQAIFKKKEKRGPIRILVPIDLRKILYSKTQRNFFLWTTPGIDTRLGDYSFDDILKHVHHHVKMTVDKKEILRQIKINVGSQLNFFLRILPLPLKRLLIKVIYSSLGEKEHSGVLTNLGKISVPASFSDQIDGFEFVSPPVPITKVSCAIASYKDTFKITFGSLIKSKELERLFFTYLVKRGIHVKIECNYQEEADGLLC